ncbi:MAG: hypothetical protein ACI3XI_03905 [Eubacteriales bacterium]
MTILEAINRTDRVKPNSYSQQEKVRWLSSLDGTVKTEIIDTHDGGEEVVFNGYNDETLLTTELLIPAPYDDVYVHYLEMQIDYANGEGAKYQNSMIVYNTAMAAFEKYYNREHMPKSHGPRFRF